MHPATIGRFVIIISKKMQQAVDNIKDQLIGQRGLKPPAVLHRGVGGDNNIPLNDFYPHPPCGGGRKERRMVKGEDVRRMISS